MKSGNVDGSFKQSEQQVCKHVILEKRDGEGRGYFLVTLLEIETTLCFQCE